ncbi:MAG TPA: hypothetical protein VGN69_07945 [Solirubrobacteraceae bacterium]|nr:hypothetical protein [Solirubrobacteraceae bacterium]
MASALPRLRRSALVTVLAVAAGLVSVPPALGLTPTVNEFDVSGATGSGLTGITVGPDGKLWFVDYGGKVFSAPADGSAPAQVGSSLAAGHSPAYITSGPDGNLWFTESRGGTAGTDWVARMTPAGVVTETAATTNSRPWGITAGSDGALWYGESNLASIGRITTTLTNADVADGSAQSYVVTTGPDGAVWFTNNASGIGRITTDPSHTTTISHPFAAGVNPMTHGITTGPDANLWFTELAGNAIGVMGVSGSLLHEYPLTASSRPLNIAAGPDGALWFTENNSPTRAAIGRVTVSGQVTEWPLTGTNAAPFAIVAGPDGNMWFTDYTRLGRISTPPIASTGSVSAVTSSAATTAGTLNGHSQTTTYHVDFGPTTAYGSSTSATAAATGAADQAVSVALSGLAPATVYHYRLVATNPTDSAYGADATFTTAGAPPGATTGPASAIGAGQATLSGSVIANNQPATAHFDYGPTAAYGAHTPEGPAGAAMSPVALSATATGLAPHTTYHYRLVATNPTGSTAGADATFTTSSVPRPPPPPRRCRVPNLRGKSLKAARKLLSARSCRLGQVKQPRRGRGRRRPALVVSTQSPKADAIRVANTRVNLSLAPKKAKRTGRRRR